VDQILIKDLLVRCIIGINDDERRERQDVLINITLFVDLRAAGHSDRLEDSLDYRGLKKCIYAEVEQSQFYLVEALAEHIAGMCLVNPKIYKAQVSVEKPSALRFARSVGVIIERERV